MVLYGAVRMAGPFRSKNKENAYNHVHFHHPFPALSPLGWDLFMFYMQVLLGPHRPKFRGCTEKDREREREKEREKER